MPFVINTETGEKELVTDADAANKLSSGEYFVEEGERLNVIDDQGTFTNIDALDYIRLKNLRGYRPATEEYTEDLRQDIAKEKEFDTLGQEIITGIEGGLRGATFGLSDAILPAVGITDSDRMRDRQDVNPVVAGVTEVGGLIGSTLLTGGSSLGAKAGIGGVKAGFGAIKTATGVGGKAAATARAILNATPAAQMSKVGTSIIAKGVGKGVAGRVLAGGVAGVVEGAAYGTGQGISELALSNEPLSAERIVSVMGSNALSGAGYGGVIGGALPVLGAIGGAVKKQVTKLPDKVKKLLPGSVRETEKELMKHRAALTEGIDSTDNVLQVARKELQDEYEILIAPQRVAEYGPVDASGIKTLNGAMKDFDNASSIYRKHFTDTGTVGLVGDRGYKTAGVVDDLLDIGGKGKDKSIEIIGEYHRAGTEMRKVLDNFKTSGFETTSSALASTSANVEASSIKGTLNKLTGAKEAIDKSTKRGLFEYLAIADVIGIDENVPGLNWIPDPILKAIVYGRLIHKHGMGHLNKKMYERVAKGASAADAATMAVASKAAIGADKVDSGIMNFLKKDRGVIDAAKKTTIPSTISILNGTSYDTNLKKSKGKDVQAAYKLRLEELDNLNASPDVVRQKVSASLGPVAESILKQVQQVQIRKISFLAKKIPRDPTGERIIPKEYKPSSMDLRKYSKYMRAAEDPTTVLTDMKNGTLSQEGAEALRVIYPAMYAGIQIKITESMPELRITLRYKDRLQLSRLFQVPVDITMEPGFINAMQDDFQATNEKGSKPGKSFSVPAMDGPVTDTLVSKKPGNF